MAAFALAANSVDKFYCPYCQLVCQAAHISSLEASLQSEISNLKAALAPAAPAGNVNQASDDDTSDTNHIDHHQTPASVPVNDRSSI